jgi:alkylated DNA nucleotide flippase Atl1
VEFQVHFRKGDRGRRRLRTGATTKPKPVEPGRIPRISRLMALAIHFDRLIRQGAVRDYADIARLGGVSKARVSQIMGLLDLAPSIQEEILFLPRVTGRKVATERGLRRIVAEPDWNQQRRLWEKPPYEACPCFLGSADAE